VVFYVALGHAEPKQFRLQTLSSNCTIISGSVHVLFRFAPSVLTYFQKMGLKAIAAAATGRDSSATLCSFGVWGFNTGKAFLVKINQVIAAYQSVHCDVGCSGGASVMGLQRKLEGWNW
jgi:hypothetical protein